MTHGKRWSDAETATLLANYQAHGADWDGWAELLPGRTIGAIHSKAHLLGLRLVPETAMRRKIAGRQLGHRPWTPEMDRAAVSAIYLLAKAVGRTASECAVRILELEDARRTGANAVQAAEGKPLRAVHAADKN